jgi:hypothetical protein
MITNNFDENIFRLFGVLQDGAPRTNEQEDVPNEQNSGTKMITTNN